ncbi:hypothetical protein BB559_001095 [Furculomyces boomerangus]|uniref:Uncharacterized protein n=2 Tax=Harpellales TaxID=61421 RepID=A0A2T9XZ67_9FUNG|nr:hypothetical protein BB559_007056 [Furculomyces boomerangus]PVU98994.1 hypothetical protein BB559_001095 [Furculomyces boomerangus]PVZ97779.1 hypothetical protein BB558_006247 [Smittium angustum]
MLRLLNSWSRASQVHPIKVLSITNAALCAIGDLISQSLLIKETNGLVSVSLSEGSYDYYRMFRFATWGFLMGPVVHRWYTFLNKNFPIQTNTIQKISKDGLLEKQLSEKVASEGSTLSTALALGKRVAVDQIVFAPVGLAAFFMFMNAAENKSYGELTSTYKHKYLETLKMNYVIWPLFQALNFSVVPLQFRVPVGSFFGIFWNTYLSYIHAKKHEVNSKF